MLIIDFQGIHDLRIIFFLCLQDDQLSQLVYYNRPDIEGPKISDYCISKVPNPEELLPVLQASLGVLGVVKKVRHLFLYGQTRIHIDKVEDLGDFMELEVVLRDEQSLTEGQQIAEDLMVKLDVNEEDLISGAYFDKLSNCH